MVVAAIRQSLLAIARILGILRLLMGRENAGVGSVVSLLHLVGGVGGAVVAGGDGGVEVDDEGEDVEGEDEGDDPLEDGGGVVVAHEVGDDEADGEEQLDNDEDQLYPEGYAEDAVLAVFWGSDVSNCFMKVVETRKLMEYTYYGLDAGTPSI